jgi:hypothetical protein
MPCIFQNPEVQDIQSNFTVLYGCETWYFALRKHQKFTCVWKQNRLLGLREGEAVNQVRIMCEEEL